MSPELEAELLRVLSAMSADGRKKLRLAVLSLVEYDSDRRHADSEALARAVRSAGHEIGVALHALATAVRAAGQR